MLMEFSVKNFQSLKEEVTLDMKAIKSISEHKDSLIQNEVLPLAAIYGPNGGGKSTVLKAFKMLSIILARGIINVSSNESYSGFSPISPFKFDNHSVNEPTEFEIMININKIEYKYSISVLKDEIIEENLSKREKRNISMIFNRTKDCTVIGEEYKKDIMITNISDSIPVLAYIKQFFKFKPVEDVLGWFMSTYIIDYNQPRQEEMLWRRMLNLESEKEIYKIVKEKFLQKLKELDTSIVSYTIEKNKDNSRYFEPRIKTIHEVDNEKYELSIDEESAGTKKLFGVLPNLVMALEMGSTVFIDELDAKLHPLLLEQIIQLFRNKETNCNNAQLIFTTHDLTTMTKENFRRDEIWFVCKNEEQYSHMYSLVEIRTEDGRVVRKDASYNKQYLEGRYGADPYFNRIRNWEN